MPITLGRILKTVSTVTPIVTPFPSASKKSIGTYLYYHAKCCLAVDPKRVQKINIIFNIHYGLPNSDGKGRKSLLRNIEENHDEELEQLLKEDSVL